ncbi:MAG: amidohydrolase family protein [Methanocellales archaeon]
MKIDAHNHVGGPDKTDGAKQSPEEIIANMDRAGVDKAVIFPFNEIDPGISFSKANDHIAKAVKSYPDKLIGFARLDPNYGVRALNELERAINKLELKGIKLHPSSQRFTLHNPCLLQILEKAAELRVPVIFDSGKPDSQPSAFAKLAEAVPEAKIIMAHMRGENYMEVVKKHSNLFLGTACMFNAGKIQEALEKLGAEKLIAGSDSPYIEMEREIKKFDSLPEKERKLILGGNIERILRLKEV